MKTNYLKFYLKHLPSKVMPGCGLCNSLPIRAERDFDMMAPTWNDQKKLRRAHIDTVYWGYGKSTRRLVYNEFDALRYEFTPLRQNIVLFMAAMNNQL